MVVLLLIVNDEISGQIEPQIIFDKTLGSINDDILLSSVQTSDGGFLLAGGTAIYQTPSGDDLHGLSNGILIKIDKDGNQLWEKIFGGEGNDDLHEIIEAVDGGYILAGSSKSEAGTGNKTSPLHSTGDYWIIKIDDQGNKIWERSYGEGSVNVLQKIILTQDGNYMLAGSSRDNDQINTDKFNDDFWLVKIDRLGNKIWGRTYGGNAIDFLESITATSDGGYIMGGRSQSDVSGDKTEGNFGPYRHDDYWIVKINMEGTVEWDKTFGGETGDVPTAIVEVEHGYLIGGHSYSTSSGNKTTELINTSGTNNTTDLWFVKVDAVGNHEWQKRIGGDGVDVLNSMKRTPDGNFVLFASSWSNIGFEKSSGNQGGADMWILKINEQADVLWDVTLGGTSEDQAFTGLPLSDSLFFLVGYSNSDISGDKSENNIGQGLRDGWVVKFGLKDIYCPTVSLGEDTVLCKGEVLELFATPGAVEYKWNKSNDQVSNALIVTDPGTYSVLVTFKDCIVQDSIHVEFTSSFCTDIIPNIITPNGDDLNEFFVIDLPGNWSVNIFNRYGQSLYESAAYKNDWNGSDLAPGVYFYRVMNENMSREFKGWLTIIR